MEIQHGSGMSPWGRPPGEEPAGHRTRRPPRRRWVLSLVRYGIPLAIFIAGLVVLGVEKDSGTALESSFMFFGVAIAVLLLNIFFRIGASGENERDREEEARRFFDSHGRWPDEDAGS